MKFFEKMSKFFLKFFDNINILFPHSNMPINYFLFYDINSIMVFYDIYIINGEN